MKTAMPKFHALHSEVLIKGPHPSPLMINKDSHLIRKPPSDTKQRNPIVIYSQTPKVFHAQPRDFMALVQRLTGMTPSNASMAQQPLDDGCGNIGPFLFDGTRPIEKPIEKEMHDFWACDKTCLAPREGEISVKKEQKYSNLGFADVPLFTPNSVYKFSDSPFGFLGSLLSPSGLEFMKELPDY